MPNTALDANTWDNNNDIVNGVWTPTKPNWYNRNEYTVSFGGPIIRNKTFIFGLWEQRFDNERATSPRHNPDGLRAKRGLSIFRRLGEWQRQYHPSGTGATPTRAVVDTSGVPKTPNTNPGANHNPATNPFTGQLRAYSVSDLGQYADETGLLRRRPGRGSWDPLRVTPDTTGD